MISTPDQFFQLAKKLNNSHICNQLGITTFEAGNCYLKWFAPSIEYPAILNSYHLFGPFLIKESKTPKLIITDSMGESDFLLDQVANKILQILLR